MENDSGAAIAKLSLLFTLRLRKTMNLRVVRVDSYINIVRLAKVDATAEKIWGEKFRVSGYPTLVFVKNG